MPNPTTIYPRFEKDFDDYLMLDQRYSKSDQPIPFEAFLRTVAFRLRDLLGTFKSDEQIKLDVRETIDFMITLMRGGVSDFLEHKTLLTEVLDLDVKESLCTNMILICY